MKEYMQAVEVLTHRAHQTYPGAIVLFFSADYLKYEAYGEDAAMLSQRMNTQLLTGGEYAFNHCTKIPAAAYHIIDHIAGELNRRIFLQQPIKIHNSAEAPMQGVFSLN